MLFPHFAASPLITHTLHCRRLHFLKRLTAAHPASVFAARNPLYCMMFLIYREVQLYFKTAELTPHPGIGST